MPAKNALLLLGTAALVGAAWLFFLMLPGREPLPASRDELLQQEQPHAQGTQPQPQTSAPASAQAQAQATLLISGHRYPISLDADKTALGAMQELASSGALTFTGKEFPSLGFFVESINGVKNAGGTYWILYRNGAQSEVGASSASISPGDVIEWRYE